MGTQINFYRFDGANNLEKFSAAMAWLREHPNGELYIPRGIYEISGESERKLYYDVIAGKYGDNPQPYLFRRDFPYTRALDFDGQIGSHVIADGVTLLFDGFFEPISLRNCQNISIDGLTIDHRRKPYSRGYIESAELNECGDGELLVRFSYDMPDTFNHPRLALYRPDTGTFLYYPFTIVGQRRCEKNMFYLRVKGAKKEFVGGELYVWHFFHSRPAVCIQNAEKICLSNITIHAHNGMGIVGHLSKDIEIEGLSVVPSSGERMSTNTDATHFASCYGNLVMRNCVFEGQGDDAVNVHNFYHAATSLGGKKYNLRCLAADGTHTLAVDLPAVNDVMQLTRRGTLDRAGEYTVVKAHENDDGTCDVVLNENLPEDTDSYYLENVSACPDFVFSHCRARNHLARSVLIKTKHAIVEHCIFEHSDLAAVVVSAEEQWGEGTSSEHVEIKDNIFIGCSMRGNRASAIDVLTASEEKTGKQHKEIIVKGNTILCPRGLKGISVENTEKAIVENNLIIQSEI